MVSVKALNFCASFDALFIHFICEKVTNGSFQAKWNLLQHCSFVIGWNVVVNIVDI